MISSNSFQERLIISNQPQAAMYNFYQLHGNISAVSPHTFQLESVMDLSTFMAQVLNCLG